MLKLWKGSGVISGYFKGGATAAAGGASLLRLPEYGYGAIADNFCPNDKMT